MNPFVPEDAGPALIEGRCPDCGGPLVPEVDATAQAAGTCAACGWRWRMEGAGRTIQATRWNDELWGIDFRFRGSVDYTGAT